MEQMKLETQIKEHYGLTDVTCTSLDIPVNDVVAVDTPSGKFALKLYSVRSIDEVQWELDLVGHLIKRGAPVVKPIRGKHGYVETFIVDGKERAGVLFEWARGEKPKPSQETYIALGKAAGEIHEAADGFTPAAPREVYDTTLLIDEQLDRMKASLIEAKQWARMAALATRLKQRLPNETLDWGICHMDLTLDNVHVDNDSKLTVFDFDSAATSWRAIEAWGVLRSSKDYFQDWLTGYRSVRVFSKADEQAVAVFAIVGDIRNIVWKLGLARSSRGEPLLKASDLPGVVDEWLEWERENIQ